MTRIAYKFLAAGAVGPFSEFTWPAPENGGPGPWVATDREPEVCARGVHAVAPERLARWIQPELWRIELDGDVVEAEGVVVARRGRLLERIDDWHLETARELMVDAVRRGRELAREHPESELIAALAEQAPGYLDGTFEPDDPWQAVATGTYVVARAAGATVSMDDPAAHDEGFDAERRRQSLWLAERLDLET